MPHAHFDNDLVKLLEFWTVQYIMLQPVICIAHIAFPAFLHAHPMVEYGLNFAYILSTTLSLSALIGFYHTFEKEIETHAPLRKLLCVKGVVAICFWQNLGVPYLAQWLQLTGQAAEDLNDVLIAVEMGMLFSFIFFFCFGIPDDDIFSPITEGITELEGMGLRGYRNLRGKLKRN